MEFVQFNAYHMPALEQNEAKHNLLLTLMARAVAEDPPHETRKWSFGTAGACALQTPSRAIVLGDLTEENCRRLAGDVAGTYFYGVLGPDDTALWFVDEAKALGASFYPPMPQRIHAISGSPFYPGAPGKARLVTPADIELFAEWFLAFGVEAVPEDAPPPREAIERKAASGDCVFWLVGGEPVSMAGIVRRTRNAAALALVYTPPELRGLGYAGSATAAVVERVYAEGRKIACLYTDLRNPASNRTYAKIGFKPVCESWFFLQIPPDAA